MDFNVICLIPPKRCLSYKKWLDYNLVNNKRVRTTNIMEIKGLYQYFFFSFHTMVSEITYDTNKNLIIYKENYKDMQIMKCISLETRCRILRILIHGI